MLVKNIVDFILWPFPNQMEAESKIYLLFWNYFSSKKCSGMTETRGAKSLLLNSVVAEAIFSQGGSQFWSSSALYTILLSFASFSLFTRSIIPESGFKEGNQASRSNNLSTRSHTVLVVPDGSTSLDCILIQPKLPYNLLLKPALQTPTLHPLFHMLIESLDLFSPPSILYLSRMSLKWQTNLSENHHQVIHKVIHTLPIPVITHTYTIHTFYNWKDWTDEIPSTKTLQLGYRRMFFISLNLRNGNLWSASFPFPNDLFPF